MNSITYKIRLYNKDFEQDNVILAIHCPLEVFYLSVKQSVLKDIPEELRKDYIILDCDVYHDEGYSVSEQIFSNLDILFKSKDFKEFCYLSYEYTKNGFDYEYECNLIGRFTTINLEADLDADGNCKEPAPEDVCEELYSVAENFVQGGLFGDDNPAEDVAFVNDISNMECEDIDG